MNGRMPKNFLREDMNITTPAIRASESNHWYTRDGVPQYTVEAKKGGQRNTTLRDARVMNLVPSVTTVLNVAAKPALTAWLQQQVLLAALTLPRRPDEPEKEYIDRIIKDSKEQGRSAADAGTDIHASIQGHYEGKSTGKHNESVQACDIAITKHFGAQRWVSERSFAHEIGFGGKCDLFVGDVDGIVVDVKTKEFTDPTKVNGYDEHLMQLAAYRVGLGIPKARCANVFVSRNVPDLVVVREWSAEDLSAEFCHSNFLFVFRRKKNSNEHQRQHRAHFGR
jgi:hypothetical protein